jgi:hypothetical protein
VGEVGLAGDAYHVETGPRSGGLRRGGPGGSGRRRAAPREEGRGGGHRHARTHGLHLVFWGSGNGGVSEPRGVRRHDSERRGGEEDRGSSRLVAESGLHGGSVPSRRA